jgi:hypothetical protein
MPSRSTFLAATLLLSCSLAAGCAQLARSLVELSRLQAAIIKEFGDKDVNVNLNNGTALAITFINSPLNDKSPEERAKRAEQTAAFVKQHYPLINQIEEIWVGFLKQETHFVFVHYSQGLGFFGFDKNGHPLRTPEPEASAPEFDPSMRPTAVYSAERKQTDVVINRLQLEGDLNYGLALLPHFTVPGDATGVRRSSSYPATVSFDFSCYSEKSMFPGAPKIMFLVDGKSAFETSEQFSTSKYDEKFSEYLSLRIPYPAFKHMTAGKKLTLRIGDREYEFTNAQLAALREMTEYVRG